MTGRPASAAAWAAGAVALGVTTLVTPGCDARAPLGERALIGTSPDWVAQLGGDGVQFPLAVASLGDLVVTGGIYDSRFTISDRTFDAPGGLDGLVAAFGPGGELRWARELAGPDGDDFIRGLAVSPSGDLFVGGHVTAGATFGDHALTVEGPGAGLFAKLDAGGGVAWAVAGGGGGFHNVAAVAAASDGGAYFAGTFNGALDLGGGVLRSQGDSDAFLARFAPTGELQWVRAFTGEGAQYVSKLAAGTNGEVMVSGAYVKQLVAGEKTVPRNSIATETPFVARYESDGTLSWVQSDLVPPQINHLGHDEDHDHPGHAPVAVTATAISVAPGGTVTAIVAYGTSFGGSGQDFEAPIARNLTATRIGPEGDVLMQKTLRAPDAFLYLGNVVAEDDRAAVSISWTGKLPALGDLAAVDSKGTRGVALVDFLADGTFLPWRIYSIPDVALTSQDTVPAADGSLLMAISWRDLQTLDEDIFLARFR